jgi:hypothetical protein
LESIIHICPLAGGPAIFRARAMYNLLNDTIFYNDKVVCANEGYFRVSQEQLMPEMNKLESQNINFKIFPNPGHDRINILTEGFTEEAEVTVYNQLGQMVDKFKISLEKNNKEIDTSTWSQGYYSFHCISGNFSAVKPLVKLK